MKHGPLTPASLCPRGAGIGAVAFLIGFRLELLLFLSAILSALTGAISGVRVPEAQMHQAYGLSAGTQAATAARTVPAPAARAWLALADGWFAPVANLSGASVGTALFAAIPLYLDKPRN